MSKHSSGSSDKKFLIIILVITVGLLGIFVLATGSGQQADVQGASSNVTTAADGSQTVTVNVDSYGYSPRTLTAKAGVATTLLMSAKNAYGCEVSFTVPKMGIRTTLPSTGDTKFDLGSQPAGTKLTGTCTMGMYSFTINFN